jgi:hypothetical protein
MDSPPTPRAVEFFAGVVLDTDIVDLDHATRLGFGSVSDH